MVPRLHHDIAVDVKLQKQEYKAKHPGDYLPIPYECMSKYFCPLLFFNFQEIQH